MSCPVEQPLRCDLLKLNLRSEGFARAADGRILRGRTDGWPADPHPPRLPSNTREGVAAPIPARIARQMPTGTADCGRGRPARSAAARWKFFRIFRKAQVRAAGPQREGGRKETARRRERSDSRGEKKKKKKEGAEWP